MVDTTIRPTGADHPFGYLDQAAIEQAGDEDTRRLVREYDPHNELVTSLLKPQERLSSYRLRVVPGKPRENLGSRTEPDQPAQDSETDPPPPDLETLKAWADEGGCEAACPHHCWVEPDGVCTHGCNSWLLELGLI